MLSNVLVAFLAVASGAVAQSTGTPVTGTLGNATVVSDQPQGPTYVARLPDNSPVQGYVTGTTGKDGNGVHFNVEFSNIPAEGGPFLYHIHVLPVAEDGNCTGTLAHLDPFIRGETPTCDASLPETCQVGDLSGKHGLVTGEQDPFTASYDDPYVSLVEGPGSFFGNRSIVFHFANKTRIGCASFELYNPSNGTAGGGNGTTPGGNSTGAPGYTAPTATGITPPVNTGAASTMVASAFGLFGAFAVAALLL